MPGPKHISNPCLLLCCLSFILFTGSDCRKSTAPQNVHSKGFWCNPICISNVFSCQDLSKSITDPIQVELKPYPLPIPQDLPTGTRQFVGLTRSFWSYLRSCIMIPQGLPLLSWTHRVNGEGDCNSDIKMRETKYTWSYLILTDSCLLSVTFPNRKPKGSSKNIVSLWRAKAEITQLLYSRARPWLHSLCTNHYTSWQQVLAATPIKTWKGSAAVRKVRNWQEAKETHNLTLSGWPQFPSS